MAQRERLHEKDLFFLFFFGRLKEKGTRLKLLQSVDIHFLCRRFLDVSLDLFIFWLSDFMFCLGKLLATRADGGSVCTSRQSWAAPGLSRGTLKEELLPIKVGYFAV